MPTYTDEVKAQCVEAVKNGMKLSEITKLYGPNPKAIQRYCKKAGVEIPKAEKAPKVDKPKKEKKAKVESNE